MNTFIILLRGVTPIGKDKVLMAPLRAALTEAGLQGVRTYIQSGNIIATSDLNPPDIENLVHKVISHRFGGDIAVLARTARQFSSILKCNPFVNMDYKKLYFSLLDATPNKKLLQHFLSIDFSPDQYCM